MKLSGKVAVITGGAQGLGKACAERFLAEGVRVVIGDINAEGLAGAARDLGHADRLLAVTGDVRQRADVERLVTAAVERFGRLDIMLNNAGIARPKDLLDITDDDYEETMGINLRGAFFGVQTAAKQFIAQGGGGVIINMSSVNAHLAIPNLATYAMAKGGMNQLTAVAAVALAPHRIRVTGIGPGTILTELAKQAVFASESSRRAVMSRTPIGRCGEPAEIASVAAFLASDDASYITGQTIYPDGGRMVLNYTVPVSDPA